MAFSSSCGSENTFVPFSSKESCRNRFASRGKFRIGAISAPVSYYISPFLSYHSPESLAIGLLLSPVGLVRAEYKGIELPKLHFRSQLSGTNGIFVALVCRSAPRSRVPLERKNARDWPLTARTQSGEEKAVMEGSFPKLICLKCSPELNVHRVSTFSHTGKGFLRARRG